MHADGKMKECGARENVEKNLVGINTESIKAFEVHWGEGIATMMYSANAQVLYVDCER